MVALISKVQVHESSKANQSDYDSLRQYVMKKATPQESFDKFVLKVEKKLLNIDALREKDEDDLKDKLYVHRTTMERQDEKITLIQEEMKEHVAKLKYLDQYQREMSIDLTKTQKELDGKETVANHQDLLT